MSDTEILCKHCRRAIRDTSEVDPNVPWVHEHNDNGYCDVDVPEDAVMFAGTPGRTVAEPDTTIMVINRTAEPVERIVFTNEAGIRIGEAIQLRAGVMVWGRDLGYDDDDNMTYLDMADDFDSAARKIAEHEQFEQEQRP